MNLDQLLDGTIDQLADKPEFKPYPAGAHVVTTFFTEKKYGADKKEAGIEEKFKYVEVGELANPDEDVAPKAGDEGMLSLNLTSKDEFQREFAQGTLKEILKALAAKFGNKSPRELMEEGKGQQAIIVTTLRSNKDKTASFLQLQKIEYI